MRVLCHHEGGLCQLLGALRSDWSEDDTGACKLAQGLSPSASAAEVGGWLSQLRPEVREKLKGNN